MYQKRYNRQTYPRVFTPNQTIYLINPTNRYNTQSVFPDIFLTALPKILPIDTTPFLFFQKFLQKFFGNQNILVGETVLRICTEIFWRATPASPFWLDTPSPALVVPLPRLYPVAPPFALNVSAVVLEFCPPLIPLSSGPLETPPDRLQYVARANKSK